MASNGEWASTNSDPGTTVKTKRRHRNEHTHEQQGGGLPVTLTLVAIVGVLVIVVQVFLYVQNRSTFRDAQNKAQEVQLANLQKEIHNRDVAIKRQLDKRDAENRKATCTLLSTIPPDDGVVDAFRKSLKCGAYRAPDNDKKAQSSSSTSPTSTKSSAPAVQASARKSPAKARTSTRTATTSGRSSSSHRGSSDTPNDAPKPSPTPAPSPVATPPAEDGTICILGICLL